MSHINDLIVYKGMVDIADRNDHVTTVFHLCPVKVQRVLDLGQQNTCQLLFDNIVGRFLEIGVNGQIQIVSCLFFLTFYPVNDPADTVDI